MSTLSDITLVKVLQIEPTVDCNAACPQCARFDGDLLNSNLPTGQLDVKTLENKLSQEFVSSLQKVFMCGNFGDPAMGKYTLEIFRWFRKQNAQITLGMNTNGSIRSISWWQQLGELFNGPRDYVVFSIDGLEDTNHIYRRNTVWKRIMENCDAYIQAGGSAHWDMLVFQHNQHQVDAAIDLARQMKFRVFRQKVSRRFDSHPIAWLRPPNYFQESITNTEKISCDSQNNQVIYMDSNGNLYPCCYIGEAMHSAKTHGGAHEISRMIALDQDYQRLSVNDIYAQNRWRNIVASWKDQPARVCVSNCSINQNNKTVARDQFKKEIFL